ncbi:Protein AATF [Morella rubra]|uniref:Protein AATF n=1 Tax=Morella rubra TaxID=262757 RepID=A0A6A1WIQ5_9ROSI|nr:Protein AATF [Morella rubra]
MGLPVKRSRKAQESDSEFEDFDDDMDSQDLTHEEDEDDDVDEEEEGEEGEGDEGEDSGRDAVMEELEKEYKGLKRQEIDILKNLRSHKDEDILKGEAVKNQKALWDKTLEFRFLVQKAFSSSNRLPQEPIRSSFSETDEGVGVAYSNLITSAKKTLDSLLGLQEALLEKNPSIAQPTDGNSGRSSKHSEASMNLSVEGDEDWSQVSQMHMRIAAFRNKSIDKWQRKTQVTTGAAAIKGKLHAFNQNISEQVAAYMRDPSRMIKQMQLMRSTVGIFGNGPAMESTAEREESQADGDPELLDDSEFYQQLLKEFFETIDPSSSDSAVYALKRSQTKKRKVVDRRASKSRKIRYHVHEKIVNFIAPLPMDLPPIAPKLFENLFGLKTPKPASVV